MVGDKIRVGIIGAGRMGITHHSIINSHPDVEVIAVADPSSVMTLLLQKYVRVTTYGDHRQLFDNEDIHAVLVCTPPGFNHDILMTAQSKGIHAFVEKPFMLTASHGVQLARLYEEKGLINQVGYVNRFNDVFVKVKDLIEDDVLGSVVHFRSEMYSPTIIRQQTAAGWRSTHASGGGALYEMAAHSIDLANFLFGRPDKVTGTCLSRVYSENVEDLVSSTFLYRSGTVGSLFVNWSDASYRKPANKLEVFARKGKLVADQHGLKIFLDQSNKKHGFEKGWTQLYITDVFKNVPFYVRGMEFTAQLYHFIDKIKSGNGAKTRCSFADGAATLAVMEELILDDAGNKKREPIK